MTERVAIVGARDASPETLAKVRALVASLPPGSSVVSGGAKGVDRTAVTAAQSHGLMTIEFIPQIASIGPDHVLVRVRNVGDEYDDEAEPAISFWKKGSMRDLLIFRNSIIALECDRMVAFAEGSNGGTWDAVKQAARFNRPCEVVR